MLTHAGLRQADAVLLIFTLAAVAPQEMDAMLRTAFQVLTALSVLVTGSLLASYLLHNHGSVSLRYPTADSMLAPLCCCLPYDVASWQLNSHCAHAVQLR